MSETQIQQNKMGVLPIPKLLVSMSLPIIVSMLVQALYNIIDSIFVARISEDALTAVSLAFPVQSLMISVATGTGVGINALLSKSLGEQKHAEANKAAKNGIFLGILSCIVFAILGAAGSRFFFVTQTSSKMIVEYGTQYLSIVTVMSFALFLQITLERLLQATGKTFFSMITQGVGAIINIILDPILIFGLFGLPKLGVAGAAIATVTGQMIAVILALFFNCKYNQEINVNMKGFRPCAETIGNIYKIGVPSIIMQSIGSVTVFGMNKILLMFSSTAAAVFGVYFKLQSFVFMPVFGLTNGMIPIVAYNYGARNKKRILQTIKLSIYIAVSIMLIGLGIFQMIPDTLLRLFDASEHMLGIGTIALRTISLSFVFAGFSIVASSSFQALGNGVYSLIISVARQLVVILPVAFAFARLFGLNMVWWSYPIAEIVSVSLCIFFLKRIAETKLHTLKKN